MTHRKILRNLTVLMIVICNIGCDQISKTIVRKEVGYNESISLIKNHFTLTRVENTGAFLSLGNSLPFYIKFIFLSLLPTIVLLYGIYILFSKTTMAKMFAVGLCFVIGGGIGNLYDRIIYGSVTDFLHIYFVIFQTGIFNMADVSIMLGMIIILIDLYFKKRDLEASSQNYTTSI